MMEDLSMPQSVCGVLPRFGRSLGGGAETLVRALLLELARPRPGGPLVERVEVWTTCAKDHRTWQNELPAGNSTEDGITVRRFPVDERDLEVFLRTELGLRDGRRIGVDEQLAWLENGVNSRALYEHIAAHGTEMDALIFAPYLFPITFWGALIHPERSLLVPCLHNEGYAYFEVFRHLFAESRGLLFNARAELELASSLYGLPQLAAKSAVVGMGFVEPERDDRTENGVPYLLYSGRKETGKNLDLLIECMEAARPQLQRPDLELRIIGSGTIDFRQSLPPGVLDLGFVSEEEKRRLMAGALALCQPSTNESFSIVLMEAWQQRTPVLVHADCEVTRQHCEQSGGGLWFSGKQEFCEVVNELLSSDALRERMGEAGYRYVAEEYSWDAVLGRFGELLARIGINPAEHSRRRTVQGGAQW